MKWAALALAALALTSGLIAALYWYRSTKPQIDPGWGPPGSGRATEPEEEGAQALGWFFAAFIVLNETSNLNRKAALWTAASVGLSGASSLLSSLAN